LPLDPQRRETSARQAQEPVEDEMTRLPARRELGAEAIEALDLEPAVAVVDEPPQQRTLEQPSEHHEVE
jgi:hypothetical protein